MSRVHKPHRWQWLWLIPAALLVWWPLWFLFMGALMSQEELRLTIGPALGLGTGYTVWHLLPDWPTLEPLLTLLLDTPQFFVMFWNSIGQSVAQVAGNLLVGAPAAWAISRLRFRGRSMVRGLYIVLMLLPFQVTMVPSYLVLRQFGLLDTPWAIILPGIFSTFPVFIMERGFDTVPREVLESASIDGANQWQRFWRIGIPLGIPGLISALTLGFLDAWNAIEQPMTFLESPQYWPLSLFFTDPANLDTKQLGLAMAASLWMLLPSILAFRFGQTYLEAGLTRGCERMSSLDVIHKLRQRLHATVAAKPNQWHTGVAMLRFLALMFLLTLLVRGTAATTLPVVSVTAPYQGVVTQSFTVSGQISPGIGTPLTIPEGLLVEQIFVQPGDQVTEGQTLAFLSLDDVRTEIEQVQASMQQHQVQANQLLAGQAADPFAWQQAQQQLDRAYADYQQAAAEGEADVSQAQNVLDAAHQVLAEVEGRKPQRPYEDGFWEMATPEQAQTEQDYADWEAEYATAQAAVQQAQADLEAAQEAADNATEAALSATQNAEDSRNSAQHNYAKETEELAKSNQTDQAGAQVLLAQIRQEDQTLKSLEALQAAGGAFLAPSDGIVTEMALTVGADTPAVAGLLAANEQEYAVTASLTAEQASLLKAGGTISVMQEQNTGTATLEQVNDDLAQFTVSGTQWKTGAADITVTTMGGTTGLCLPATAVNSDNAGNFVYLVETKNTVLGVQSVLVRLGVTVEERGDGVVRISGALSGQEQIVSASSKPLSAGTEVRIDE